MEKEAEILKKHIQVHQLKLTRQRQVILDTFLTLPRHVSAEELYEASTRKNRSIGLATVYRTLHLLCQAGIVQEREFGDGQARYEIVSNHSHHDHLVCLSCGRIIEFENMDIENLQEQVAKEHSFIIQRHKLELYGYCKTCHRSTAHGKKLRKNK
ncbi:MAG: transcriptional repressor [Nitrospirae bacterium]|nr:transcriptional repressor [Nitrospirota bacterium]MBI3594219.1 transcriptional repressor [Nitrospirota bacterium]